MFGTNLRIPSSLRSKNRQSPHVLTRCRTIVWLRISRMNCERMVFGTGVARKRSLAAIHRRGGYRMNIICFLL